MEKDKSSSSSSSNEEQAALSIAAASHFKARNYEKCLEALQKLKSCQAAGEPEDLRIQHNIAVAQFYAASPHEPPQKLLEQLEKLKKKIEERRKQSGDPEEEGVYATALEGAVLGYNEAFLLASTKHYSAAVALLEPLYRHIEPLDEFLTLKICFLLLELYHITFQPDKANGVALHLEKAFLSYFLQQQQLASQTQPQPPPAVNIASLGPLAADLAAGDEGTDQNGSKEAAPLPPPGPKTQPKTNVALTELKAHIHLARARTFLLPSAGTSAATIATASSTEKSANHDKEKEKATPSGVPAGRNMNAAKRELKLAQQAAHQEKNEKESKGKSEKLIAPTPAAAAHSLTVATAFVKAQLEYLRSHHAKALKILLQTLQQASVVPPVPWSDRSSADRLLPTCVHNGIGCVQARQRRFRSAAFSFNKALQENTSLVAAERPHGQSNQKELKLLTTTAIDKRVEILYNVALAQLHSGNPELAFSCFQEVLSFYAQSPRIWLRIAECCIAIYQNRAKQPEELRPESVGSGVSRRVVLTRAKQTETTKDEKVSSPLHQVASLEYAYKCLLNTLLLCGHYSHASAAHAQQQFPLSELHQIRFAALLNVSFVQLSLSHYAAALAAANQLLAANSAELPPHVKFSARMYAAEALCRLDRSNEALEHFSPVVLEAIGASGSSSASSSSASSNPNVSEGSTESVAVQRLIYYTNAAAAHALAGDLERANSLIKEALHAQANSHHHVGSHASSALGQHIGSSLFALGVYVSLRRGHSDQALDQLKRGRTFYLTHGPGRSSHVNNNHPPPQQHHHSSSK